MAARSLFIDRSALSIGADPEFFLKKGDVFVSGHRFPCGSKDNPRKTEHGTVQCDGVALEVNVHEAFTKDKFVMNFRGVVNDLSSIVKNWDKSEAYIVADPVAVFEKAYLEELPIWAKELGCNPDYNAYTLSPNPLPDGSLNIRTGAGHLHLGWTEDAEGLEHFSKCSELTKQLDYTVGLRTLLYDDENRRRLLYGQAGAFRPKPYGLEYRVPSNAWCQSEELAGLMFDGCTQAVDKLNDGFFFDAGTPGLARRLINENNVNWVTEYPRLADMLEL